MCGIAGIVDLQNREPVAVPRVRAMLTRLRHRGPDAEDVATRPGLAFGHRRLAVIDIVSGAQPMASPDEAVLLVYNGEIYNFRELRGELERGGVRFRTQSDTEVLLEGYRAWGVDVVTRLRGMFAFALWDATTETLLLARDRLGEKPLYYARTPDHRLVFASELDAVLAGLDTRPPLAEDAVADFFAFGYVPDPKAIYAGVHKLPPAHVLVVRRGERERLEPRRYWRPDFTPRHRDAPEILREELTRRLREAVGLQLVADVPLGAFLSGGVDSSGVVALMAEAGADPLIACSIGFAEPEADETAYARLVAERYRARHHVRGVEVTACALLDRLAEVYGEPFADPSALPTYLVSGFAREHVTVALSGDGGDELFAGYRRYPFHLAEERIKRRLPEALRRRLVGPLARAYPKLDWAPRALRAKATLEALAADTANGYLRAVTPLPRTELGRLLAPSLLERLDGYDPAQVIARHLEEAGTDDLLGRAQYVDLMTWLPGRMLVKVDRASMAHGLEVRPPLLDPDLVDWAGGLPIDAKLDGFKGKRLLKEALEPFVPRALLDRPKQGFGLPLRHWLRRGLDERLAAMLTSGRLEASGMVAIDVAKDLVEAHRSGLRDHGAALWTLLTFDAFLARHMGQTAGNMDAVAAG